MASVFDAILGKMRGADLGVDGTRIHSGAGDPTDEGVDGDFYLKLGETAAWLFGPKAAGVWPGEYVNLDGPQGDPGVDAPAVLSGTAAPTTEGDDGDFYIRLDTGIAAYYGPKAAGVWPAGINLVGAAGADGADGADGAAGADGKTILYGTAAPTTEGVNGDFYIRTTTSYIYGPKAAGVWPAGTSLVGATGSTGATGAAGTPSNLILKSSGTLGANATNIDISSLDINTDGEYLLILHAAAYATAAGEDLLIYLNADYTDSHYHQEGMQLPFYAWGVQNKPWLGCVLPSGTTVEVKLRRNIAGTLLVDADLIGPWPEGGSNIYGMRMKIAKSDATASNLTAIRITSALASGLRIGTKWWLYKLTRA